MEKHTGHTMTDPEIVELCGAIVKSQRQEIAQMEAILNRA
jgi:uncharacterized protein (DUF305 family)